MRNISCSHTKEQVRNRTKTVTRRLGWETLKPGTLLRIVEKAMGLKKGEPIVPMAIVKVTSVRREPVRKISRSDCAAEGFPNMKPREFIEFFTETFRCNKSQHVTRIEWVYESRCLLCGFEISKDSSLCGECTCEDE